MRQSNIIGSVFVTTLSLVVATLIGAPSVHIVYANAKCDKAGESINPAGNDNGNSKQCGFPESQGSKEPVRNCNSPNQFKDNDADSFAACRLRANK